MSKKSKKVLIMEENVNQINFLKYSFIPSLKAQDYNYDVSVERNYFRLKKIFPEFDCVVVHPRKRNYSIVNESKIENPHVGLVITPEWNEEDPNEIVEADDAIIILSSHRRYNEKIFVESVEKAIEQAQKRSLEMEVKK